MDCARRTIDAVTLFPTMFDGRYVVVCWNRRESVPYSACDNNNKKYKNNLNVSIFFCFVLCTFYH